MFVKIASPLAKEALTKKLRALSIDFEALRKPGPVSIGYNEVVEEFTTVLSVSHMGGLGFLSYTSSPTKGMTIGRYCSIAGYVRIMGEAHPTDWVTTHPATYSAHFRNRFLKSGLIYKNKPYDNKQPDVHIGNDVWIGAEVTLKGGITIGDGAVIATKSVVTRDVGPHEIVGGIPAKLIRKRFSDDVSERLLKSEWWNSNILRRKDLDASNPEAFLRAIETKPPKPETFRSLTLDVDLLLEIAPPEAKKNERADYLRDTALQLEKTDKSAARRLMREAKKSRPGAFILKKLLSYDE